MGMTFTEDQQKVIKLHNRNILVSAAAGSGKTAVLVERIIQMISDEKNPVDIDRLLVLTFTNAAAAEMRERISLAISKKLEEMPENGHLQKQATLIHNAQITTIHKFCLFIIHNNFNDIGLDPAFRVADENEVKLLSKDVLSGYLEEKFTQNSQEFMECAEFFNSNSNGKDTNLEGYIEELYKFAMSYPFPKKWLKERQTDYEMNTVEELEKSEFIVYGLEQVSLLLSDCLEYLDQALNIAQEPDGPYMYCEMLESDRQIVENLLTKENFREFFLAFQNINHARLSGKKDDSVAPDKKENVKEMRDTVKDNLKKIREIYFFSAPEVQLAKMQQCHPVVSTLLELVMGFKEKLDEKKRDKGLIDFNDMEHFALEILIDNATLLPTPTACDYQQYFEEILVDEYQDSNLVQEYLLQSISKEGTGQFNRFMVGDVKQSIYKFRLARPEIFMDKFNSYDKNDSLTQRIDLHKNFRSRPEVIDSVNFIFSQIMAKDLGKVEYDYDAALYQGAVYPENTGNETELLLVDMIDSNEDKKETEAFLIAKKIKEMVGKFLVTDKNTQELRPAKYSDMVILLRTNSGWDDVFSKILIQEGIPAYVSSKSGYFAATEVSVLLHFLRIVDNPLQDIPLFGVLHSIVGGFTDEELAEVQIEDSEKTYLYHKLEAYEQKGTKSGLKDKIGKFLTLLEEFRQMVVYTPIHKLIQHFMKKTGYYYIYSALPGGEQRQANLDLLMEKAIGFEKTSYYGLFHFIRYIEQIEKSEVEYGEASILDENADVVRIMSIHKSKGLEFPICFVSGLQKEFNKKDSQSPVIVDVDMGIGTICVDLKNRTKSTTLRKTILAKKMQLENIGEELRVLYVALTRAREKLILTGVSKDIGKLLTGYDFLKMRNQTILPYDLRSQSSSYMDFIIPALIRNQCFKEEFTQRELEMNSKNSLYQTGPKINVQIFSMEDLSNSQIKEQVKKELYKKRLEIKILENREKEESYKKIAERFTFRYPFENLSNLYIKTTVSELKKKGREEESEGSRHLYPQDEIIPYIPGFIEETEHITGTVRGSAYHKVMELYDLLGSRTIKEEMAELLESQKLSKEYYDAVSDIKIQTFLGTRLAARMKDAEKNNKLFREQPFVLGVSANELDSSFPDTETILVQGVIDLYFEEEDGLVVADYKTDRVTEGSELINRYQTQLDYYARALEQFTGKKVKEKIIYSFALEDEILL